MAPKTRSGSRATTPSRAGAAKSATPPKATPEEIAAAARENAASAHYATLPHRRPTAEALRDGMFMVFGHFVFIVIALAASYGSQIALAPVYGSAAAGMHHRKIAS